MTKKFSLILLFPAIAFFSCGTDKKENPNASSSNTDTPEVCEKVQKKQKIDQQTINGYWLNQNSKNEKIVLKITNQGNTYYLKKCEKGKISENLDFKISHNENAGYAFFEFEIDEKEIRLRSASLCSLDEKNTLFFLSGYPMDGVNKFKKIEINSPDFNLDFNCK